MSHGTDRPRSALELLEREEEQAPGELKHALASAGEDLLALGEVRAARRHPALTLAASAALGVYSRPAGPSGEDRAAGAPPELGPGRRPLAGGADAALAAVAAPSRTQALRMRADGGSTSGGGRVGGGSWWPGSSPGSCHRGISSGQGSLGAGGTRGISGAGCPGVCSGLARMRARFGEGRSSRARSYGPGQGQRAAPKTVATPREERSRSLRSSGRDPCELRRMESAVRARETASMKVLTQERCISLPPPAHEGRVALERALWLRRSRREFSARSLRLADLAQLLWATQGMTGLEGRRTTPSAGSSYPLELHVLAGSVESVAPGRYRYLPRRHVLLERAAGDRREALAHAALEQAWIAHAPAVLVVTAVPERTTFTYGERGTRYVQQEAGSAAQNLQLQAAVLGLASAVVGAFRDDEVARLIDLPAWEEPVCMLPVGWPAEKQGLSC